MGIKPMTVLKLCFSVRGQRMLELHLSLWVNAKIFCSYIACAMAAKRYQLCCKNAFMIKNQWLYCAEKREPLTSLDNFLVCLFWIGMTYVTMSRNRDTFALLMCHISVCPIIYNEWIQSDGKWQSPAHLRISTLNRWRLKTCRIIYVCALAMKNYVYFWLFIADHKKL